MPAAVASHRHEVSEVVSFAKLLESLLARSTEIKSTPAIEPALHKADFGDLDNQLGYVLEISQPAGEEDAPTTGAQSKAQQFAIIETAVRDMFSNLIVHQLHKQSWSQS